MVGSPPKQLESGVCESIAPQSDQLKEDISEYLLLHHDYAAKPEMEPKRNRRTPARRKLKEIKPKTQIVPDSQEILYGTYDETTNSITILVNGEQTPLNEEITEVVTTTDNMLRVPDGCFTQNPSSPSISSVSSDCGYESYDSPHSAGETDADVWDETMSELSELFPSLL